MTIDFVEKRLKFSFDSSLWSALKWDDDPAFVDGLRGATGTKGVDFIAVLHRSRLYLLEVKDPRGYAIQYRRTLTSGEIVDIVAGKVRDTLAGLPWAQGRVPADHLRPFLSALFIERTTRLEVVLWLEDADKAMALAIKGLIERKLTWLKPNVSVVNRALLATAPGFLLGLDVTSMPGAHVTP